MIKFIRQLLCKHVCILDDLKRVSVVKGGVKIDGGQVEVACIKCGKVFREDYGLMMNVHWIRRK